MADPDLTALEVVTYLGANTVELVERISRQLSDNTGLDVYCDTAATWDVRMRRIRHGDAAVIWMCGLLGLELLDTGGLDAEIVAAPVFPGEAGPVYHSVIVARPGVERCAEATLAVNEAESWSGHHALRAHLATSDTEPDAVFGAVRMSGGHDESIDLMLSGRADIAAIDHTIWDHRLARDPAARRLRVVDRTQDWPAPPFLVSTKLDPRIRRTLTAGLIESVPAGLDAIVPAERADYEPIRAAMTGMQGRAWFVPDTG